MDNYEAAEERFFIMTEQKDVTDVEALKYIREKYGKEIAVRIWKAYCEGKNEKQGKHY